MDLDIDEESANPELAYLAIIRQIRDNNIDLFEKIKKLPKKAKTGRNSEIVNGDTTLSFIRKGFLKTFFFTSEDQTTQINFLEAIKFLQCEPEEEKVSVGKEYFDHFAANNEAFDNSLQEEEVVTTTKPAVAGNDQKIIRYLKGLLRIKGFTDEQEDKLKRMIEVWENGDIPANVSKSIVKSLKNIEPGVEAYYQIIGQVDDKYLEGRKPVRSSFSGEKQVILSCYMKGLIE